MVQIHRIKLYFHSLMEMEFRSIDLLPENLILKHESQLGCSFTEKFYRIYPSMLTLELFDIESTKTMLKARAKTI